jgi:hypothetical protein
MKKAKESDKAEIRVIKAETPMKEQAALTGKNAKQAAICG